MKEVPVIFSEVSFIGIDFFDRVLGMATSGNTERKIGAVMVGSRSYFRSENEPVVGVNSGVLFKTEVRDVIFDRPVGIKITGEFKDIPIFIKISCGFCSFLFLFFQFVLTYGMAGRLNQTGVNGYAFIDG